ncbi:MAG: SDR family NAD(P)-dependent oxidoreductase [Chloroflexi bacterium]|jgi:NAD(P)-dependent dehydrogenase (short-subunit alcohol dehydrogenase family)|nr:SDR family NAD(P)-dependent oxidoreductase [Chloroflexota bacterium]
MNSPVIIITGASRGLGAAAAKIAARLGATVVLNARSVDALEKVAAEIRVAGGQVLALPGDVSQPDVCHQLVSESVARFGRLDAVVNNAGVIRPIAPISTANPDEWQRLFEINLVGPLRLIQAALPHLRESRGRVVNVSSGAAVKVVQGWGAYSASKAALNHFTQTLAAEEPLVTSLALRPGAIDTEMQVTIRADGERGMTPEAHGQFSGLYREQKLLRPEVPGRALATLALHAPPELNGEFVSWDDSRVQALYAGASY